MQRHNLALPLGKHYQQLSIVERCEIARLSTAGLSKHEIAAALDRSPPTISRELSRNASANGDYQPEYAQRQAQACCWRGARLERDAVLREDVLSGISAGWSPENDGQWPERRRRGDG